MPRRTKDQYFLQNGSVSDPALTTALGSLVNVEWIEDWLLYVKNTGVSGTTPSITLAVQGTINRTDWVTLKTFAATTAAGYVDDSAAPASPPPTKFGVLRLIATAKSGTTPALTGVTAGVFSKGYS